jgi:hypothetical protein
VRRFAGLRGVDVLDALLAMKGAPVEDCPLNGWRLVAFRRAGPKVTLGSH